MGCLVGLGWGQVPSRDYNGMFVMLWRLRNIRTVLAIAAEYSLEYRKLNYKTAFYEEVYVQMVSRYKKFDF